MSDPTSDDDEAEFFDASETLAPEAMASVPLSTESSNPGSHHAVQLTAPSTSSSSSLPSAPSGELESIAPSSHPFVAKSLLSQPLASASATASMASAAFAASLPTNDPQAESNTDFGSMPVPPPRRKKAQQKVDQLLRASTASLVSVGVGDDQPSDPADPSTKASVSNGAGARAHLLMPNPDGLPDDDLLQRIRMQNLEEGALNPLAHHIMQRALDLGSHSDADRDPAELQSTPKGKDRKPKGFFKWKGKSSTEPHGLEDDDFGHTHASPAKADVPSRPPDRPKPSQSHSRTPSQLDEEPGEDFVKVFTSKKPAPAFNHLRQTQDLSGLHVGAIWTVKFSFCGRLMATAGQDTVVRVWSVKDTGPFLEEMKRKFGRTDAPETASSSSSSSASRPASTHGSTSTMLHATFPDGSGATARATTAGPSPVHSRPTSVASTTSHASDVSAGGFHSHARTEGPGHSRDGSFGTAPTGMSPEDWQLFEPQPVCQYKGHSADVLDVSWSKNYFLLSSSMDKTVRLWHIVRQECLCVFQHADFVTAIAFHPRDDRYFLSGSMDSTLRLWNIPEKKVALWNEIVGPSSSFITAANFCQNGKMAVVGTYDGRCLFYDSERLKYHTQILVRSSRGKNSKGRKITAIEPMPGEDKILITSNDSRIRLYDLKDLTLTCKYKGSTNSSSQIKASFSNDGKYIICGSEYQNVYVWNTFLDDALVRKGKLSEKFTGFRRDRNESFEFFAASHDAVVTVAIFAPYATAGLKGIEDTAEGEVIVTADFTGKIKVFINQHPSHSAID